LTKRIKNALFYKVVHDRN